MLKDTPIEPSDEHDDKDSSNDNNLSDNGASWKQEVVSANPLVGKLL